MTKLKEIEHLDLDIVELDSSYKKLIHSFNCGDFAFNSYLISDAIKHKTSGDGVTFIVIDHIDKNTTKIVAYYTISAFTVNSVDRYDYDDDDIPEEEKRERFSPIPAIMISRFAVDESYQDSLYNGELIASAILKGIICDIHGISQSILGAKMITLCSVEDAVGFYEKCGFKKLDSRLTLLDFMDAQDNAPMYLALHHISSLCMDTSKESTA